MAKRSKSNKSSASRAAVKGWQTRRANARKRSESAKRGWKTRKKNERKRKRKIIATPRGQVIENLTQWETLRNFMDAEAIEVVANADY